MNYKDTEKKNGQCWEQYKYKIVTIDELFLGVLGGLGGLIFDLFYIRPMTYIAMLLFGKNFNQGFSYDWTV